MLCPIFLVFCGGPICLCYCLIFGNRALFSAVGTVGKQTITFPSCPLRFLSRLLSGDFESPTVHVAIRSGRAAGRQLAPRPTWLCMHMHMHVLCTTTCQQDASSRLFQGTRRAWGSINRSRSNYLYLDNVPTSTQSQATYNHADLLRLLPRLHVVQDRRGRTTWTDEADVSATSHRPMDAGKTMDHADVHLYHHHQHA